MLRPTLLVAVAAISLLAATKSSSAADTGNAAEAKKLLERAVVAIKADEPGAIAKFNQPAGGFRDHDLYVFCAGPDGKIDANANPSVLGTILADLKDKSGKPFGREIVTVAQEGKFSEVSYMWPRPGTSDPVQKTSYVTKVAHHTCGVGYYN